MIKTTYYVLKSYHWIKRYRQIKKINSCMHPFDRG